MRNNIRIRERLLCAVAGVALYKPDHSYQNEQQISNACGFCGRSWGGTASSSGLALDAELELVSGAGSRRLPLRDFIVGNRKTLRRPDEILSRVIVSRRLDDAASAFLKLGARRYLVISIAMVAAIVQTDRAGL